MTGFKRFSLAVLATGLTASLAMAGVNAGGVLQFHTDDVVEFSSGVDYSGQSGIQCLDDNFDCPPYDPTEACDHFAANPTSANTSGYSVFWVLAAFHPESCPRVKAVTFAIKYPPALLSIEESGKAGDLEIPGINGDGEEWPATESGVGVTFNAVRTSHLFEIYWFAGYVYGSVSVQIWPHRTQGGPVFADDSVPAIQDQALALSTIGFGTPGENLAPTLGPTPTVEGTWGQIKSTYTN